MHVLLVGKSVVCFHNSQSTYFACVLLSHIAFSTSFFYYCSVLSFLSDDFSVAGNGVDGVLFVCIHECGANETGK